MRIVGLIMLIAAAACGQEKGAISALVKGAQALLQTNRAAWPTYTLRSTEHWLLGATHQRFDASGLLFLTNGWLLTLNDRGPTPYRINFLPGTNVANLFPLTNLFSPAQLKPFARDKL